MLLIAAQLSPKAPFLVVRGTWEVGGGLMDQCKPFTTNRTDNKEQMLASWRVSESDFVEKGHCIFPVIWV